MPALWNDSGSLLHQVSLWVWVYRLLITILTAVRGESVEYT